MTKTLLGINHILTMQSSKRTNGSGSALKQLVDDIGDIKRINRAIAIGITFRLARRTRTLFEEEVDEISNIKRIKHSVVIGITRKITAVAHTAAALNPSPGIGDNLAEGLAGLLTFRGCKNLDKYKGVFRTHLKGAVEGYRVQIDVV